MDLETSLSWGFIVAMFFSILYLAHKVDKIYKMLDVLQKAINKLLDFQSNTVEYIHKFEIKVDDLEKKAVVNHEETKANYRQIGVVYDYCFKLDKKLSDVKTTIDESLKKLESRNDKDYFDAMI